MPTTTRREQQQKTFDLTHELESWLLAAADKPTTPLTKADFTAIRERVCVLKFPPLNLSMANNSSRPALDFISVTNHDFAA